MFPATNIPSDILAHPSMKAIMADVEESRRQQEMNRLAQAQEAARIRSEQGKYLHDQYQDALKKYEDLRKQLHQQVRMVWEANQAYTACTGVAVPEFPLKTFNEIHLPKLDGSEYGSGFSSTRVSTMAWFQSGGKVW